MQGQSMSRGREVHAGAPQQPPALQMPSVCAPLPPAGVGGEYPVASSSAAERAEGSRAMRRRRGETVVLTFSQQGWGNLSNTLCILLLLAVQGATGDVVTPKQVGAGCRGLAGSVPHVAGEGWLVRGSSCFA